MDLIDASQSQRIRGEFNSIVLDTTGVREAIDFFIRADVALENNDLVRERYWLDRAFTNLKRYGPIPNLMPSLRPISFQLDEYPSLLAQSPS